MLNEGVVLARRRGGSSRLSVLLIALLVALSVQLCSFPIQTVGASVQRVVLAELFTATWCGYCPYATQAINQLSDEYGPSQLLVLQYHPSGSDPFGIAEADDRISYYGVYGYPTMIFDGTNQYVGGGSGNYGSYKAKIDAELQKPTEVSISLAGSMTDFTANVTASNLMPPTSATVRFVVYEDNIPYNAPNGETLFRFTVRAVLNEQAVTLSPGQTVSVQRTFLPQAGWNIDNLGLVVFVQKDGTREVLQAVTLLKPTAFSLTSYATVKVGQANTTVPFYAILANKGALDDSYNVTLAKSLPAGWIANFCVGGVCYSTSAIISANSCTSQNITVNIITSQTIGRGVATLSAASQTDPTKNASITFVAITYVLIRADGSVDPPSAPILNIGNAYYTFTADINGPLVVERNNIVVDGAGYTLLGPGIGNGISLVGRSNVTVKSIRISNFGVGINLTGSSGNTLSANTITNSTAYGVYVYGYSNNNSISANTITNSSNRGVYLAYCSNNNISTNIVTNNYYGIHLYYSSGNSLSANTITNNNVSGITLSYSLGNSLSGNTITNNYYGIYLARSNSTSISANTITNNTFGIQLDSSSGNSISTNIITNNSCGILVYASSGNSISANTITNNDYGVYLSSSSGNLIYHNNFVGNTVQAEATSGYMNAWDDGYPSGGNYWSDYAGTDSNGDGIGDTPYVIDANNTDHYPLMNPWAPVTDIVSMAVRGQNNLIYYRTYNITTASWAGWNALPGATCDSPAATVCGNELHFVVRGMDGNTLWHGYVNLIGGGFSGWTLLGGSTPSAPTLTSNGTALSLAVRGQNNLIYYRFYDCASRAWTDWAALPSGSTCDGPAATMLGNKLHVVVRSMDGYTLWHSSADLSTGTFSGWQLIGGATESKPTLAACESRNEIVLVVRGLNNVIYRNSWTGSSWAGWAGLPTGSTCDGVGATVIGETLHVAVRGMDGYTLWHGNVDLTTSAFSGWTILSGSTPSPPTLTS